MLVGSGQSADKASSSFSWFSFMIKALLRFCSFDQRIISRRQAEILSSTDAFVSLFQTVEIRSSIYSLSLSLLSKRNMPFRLIRELSKYVIKGRWSEPSKRRYWDLPEGNSSSQASLERERSNLARTKWSYHIPRNDHITYHATREDYPSV